MFNGIFVKVMAFRCNRNRCATNPFLCCAWFFENVVAVAPSLSAIVTGAGEKAAGLLIISRGRPGGAGTCQRHRLSAPRHSPGRVYASNPHIAAGLARLLTKDFRIRGYQRRGRLPGTGSTLSGMVGTGSPSTPFCGFAERLPTEAGTGATVRSREELLKE
jgi:hypothetical protein